MADWTQEEYKKLLGFKEIPKEEEPVQEDGEDENTEEWKDEDKEHKKKWSPAIWMKKCAWAKKSEKKEWWKKMKCDMLVKWEAVCKEAKEKKDKDAWKKDKCDELTPSKPDRR